MKKPTRSRPSKPAALKIIPVDKITEENCHRLMRVTDPITRKLVWVDPDDQAPATPEPKEDTE